MGCGNSNFYKGPESQSYVVRRQVEIASAMMERTVLDLSNRSCGVVGPLLTIRSDLDQYNVLDICNCRLTELPEQIWAMPYLIGLHLRENILTSLESLSGKRSSLRLLDVSGNPLRSLGDSLKKLTQLETLYASKCSLCVIPEYICSLTSLTSLSLFDNCIVKVPIDIRKLVHLQDLNLASNKIAQFLPGSLDNLSRLRHLVLFWNQISLFPSCADLESLEELQLDGNRLTVVPNFGHHPCLDSLQLAKNHISSIPHGVFTSERFPNLHTLELSHNQLTDFPPECCRLPLLRLSLAGNQFTTLPVGLWHMKGLMYLNLESNQLEALSEEIGNLHKQLATLFLSNNRLTTFPISICELKHLKRFSCKNNPLNLADPETSHCYHALKAIVSSDHKFVGI